MLDRATVGIVQWLPVPGRGDTNLEYALDQIRVLAGCDLIVLPELWVCGVDVHATHDSVRAVAEPVDGPRARALAAAARAAGSWLVAGSMPEASGDHVYNTALVFDRVGRLRGSFRKVHLYAVMGEDRAFAAGDSLLVVDTEDFGPMGVVICFDGDFPEVGRALGAAGARVIVHPSAYETAAASWWDRLYPAHALSDGQWWISSNQCGVVDALTLLGASRIVSPSGAIVAEAVRAAEGATPDPVTMRVEIELAAGLAEWDRDCSVLRDGLREHLAVSRNSIAG